MNALIKSDLNIQNFRIKKRIYLTIFDPITFSISRRKDY